MSKMIIVGDIHIHEFQQHNSEGFRLKQFIQLAHRLVEMGKEQKVTMLTIAGDLVHKAQHEPKIAHATAEFMDILGTHFTEIYYILGNHDINSKAATTDHYENSIVPILAGKAEYVDGKILTLGGRKVAFSDWRPTQDFSFIEDKVDVLIGHITLSKMFGQEFDDSKYEIGFAGDIHQPVTIGHTHSTNVPIPHGMGDCQDGSVILLDLKDLSWERLPVLSESFKYLKMYWDDMVPPGMEDYPHLVVRERMANIESTQILVKSIDVEEVIDKVVRAKGLKEVHTEMSTHVNREESVFDLNFTLKNIKVENFRSIDQLQLDFKNGLTYLYGDTGNGKSSLLRALNYCLTGGDSPRNVIRRGQDHLLVEVMLEHGGREYLISRHWAGGQTFRVWIDGDEMDGVSIRDREAKLWEMLPFLEHFDLLYRSQNSPPFLSQFGFNERINLITKMLGLTIINQYEAVGKAAARDCKIEINNHNTQVTAQEEVLKSLEGHNFSKLDDVTGLEEQRDRIQPQIATVKSKIKDLENLASKMQSLQMLEDSLAGFKIDFTEDEVNSDLAKARDRITELESEISEMDNNVNSLRGESTQLTRDLARLESELDKLEKDLRNVQTVCPTCKQSLKEEDVNQVKQSIQSKIDSIETEGAASVSKLERVEKDLSNAPKSDKLREELTTLQSNCQELRRKAGVLQDVSTLRGKIHSVKTDVEVYQTKTKSYDSMEVLEKELSALDNELIEVNSKIGSMATLRTLKARLDDATEKLEFAKAQLDILNPRYLQLVEYQNLFNNSGDVTASIFREVAAMMSGGDMVISTVREQANGAVKIDFDVQFKVGDLLIPYAELSGGQQNLVDILFIGKLISLSKGAGCLILDESLKNLDTNTLDLAIDQLVDIPVNHIILVTHVPTFQRYNTKIGAYMSDNVTTFMEE